MKHRWTTLLWELWAAQLLCTAAAMLPGSRVCTMPGLALPALGLAAAVPTAWFVWGVWAEPLLPLPKLWSFSTMEKVWGVSNGR